MNEGDPKNREYWVQIITTIPEISSTDHSRNQTTDKRIITKTVNSKNSYGTTMLKFDNSDDILQFQDHFKCAPYLPQYVRHRGDKASLQPLLGIVFKLEFKLPKNYKKFI